jgi:hypothetical protein
MKFKLAAVFVALFFASLARADSQYTITFDVLQESANAPTPSFGMGTLGSNPYNGPILEFSFVPDDGAPTAPEAFQDFSLTEPVYFCDGCNPPYELTGTPPQLPGSVVFYLPGNDPEMYTIENAFPAVPGYFAYGTLHFTDPAPMNTPEPSTGLLMAVGFAFVLAYAVKPTKNSRQADSNG